MAVDLKPCPFCGSAPELRSSHGWHAVGCNTTKCPAHIHALVHRSEAVAVTTWNTRSAGEAPASHLLGELWCAFGDYEGRLIALPEYAAASERAVKEKIVEAARREGFTGTAEYRMAALGWTILRVAPAAGVAPAPQCPKGCGLMGTFFDGWRCNHCGETARGVREGGKS